MNRLLPLLAIALAGSAMAAPPAWWTAPTTGIKSGAPANNSGPVNGAQLKNVAKKAALYLNNELPSPGAGAAVNAMVNAFAKSPGDLSPVNLGQLKAVAKPFYDRLLSTGVDTKLNLQSHGAAGWAYDYPWLESTPKEDNYGPANIGQLKWVFSFEVTGFGVAAFLDADADGLPDWWETSVAGGTSGGALGDWNNDGIKNVSDLVAGVANSATSEDGLIPASLSLKTYTLLAL